MLAVSVGGKLRQGDHEFKASLDSIVNSREMLNFVNDFSVSVERII